MKPRRRHLTTVSSYAFWLQPAKPPQWEWFCCCGAQQSGYPEEGDAELGAYDHEQSFELVDAGVAVAILGISSAGWLAFGIVAVVVCAALVMLARACRGAIDVSIGDDGLETGPPAWVASGGKRVVVYPSPDEMWGWLNTDAVPPEEGAMLRIPGSTWQWVDGGWVKL